MEEKLKYWFSKEELKKLITKDIEKCIEDCSSPAKEDIFNAFEGLKPEDVKVLIIGQDPYPDKKNKKIAHGLAFSSNAETLPTTLEKIFIEIQNEFPEISKKDFERYNLDCWKKQGVLLLNSSLTYCKNIAKDDRVKIWQKFINAAIDKILAGDKPLVVMLWGGDAQSTFFNNKKIKIERKVLILQSSHPQPRNKKDDTFENCGHFKECNEFLGKDKAINWQTYNI